MDLKEAGLIGDEAGHWYYRGKLRALSSCLEARSFVRILDVGAGSGFFAKALLRSTAAASATCVDPGYGEDRSGTEAGKPLVFRRTSPVGDADLVLLMDVIEHVDDDVALLRSYVTPARPGTRFVVSVPAFDWLWSRHDEFLGHRRRYTRKRLLRVLSDAGLSNAGAFYFFAAILPAVAIHRVTQRWGARARPPASDLRPHGRLANSLLSGLCRAECVVARHNRAFGLTVFGTGEKG
jgi:SAM-dependent methyltransferase